MKGVNFLLIIEGMLLVIAAIFLIYDKKSNTGIWKTIDMKMTFIILIVSIVITYCVSFAIKSGITKILLFVFIFSISPYVLLSNKRRIDAEKTFDDVIIYCSNMGMLLKQTHNVYSSLDKTKNDYSDSFNDDIKKLMSSLTIDKSSFKKALIDFEMKYQYSIVQDLDILMIHMFYENSNVLDEQFEMFLKEVSSVENDVKQNKRKRKVMRIQYIGISVGSIITYWYFYNSLKETFESCFEGLAFNFVNMLFIFGTIISLFFVDRYFNSHITKE